MLSDTERRVARIVAGVSSRMPRSIGRLAVDLLRCAMVYLLEAVEHRGYSIVDFASDPAASDRMRNVVEALDLLARVDPVRLSRFRRYCKRIAIAPTPGTDGQYWPRARAVALDRGFLLRASVEEIALAIVHETAHARLAAVGIGYGEAIRPRVERACVGEERRFARRLPQGQQWTECVERRNLDPEYLSDAEMRERKRTAVARLLSSDEEEP